MFSKTRCTAMFAVALIASPMAAQDHHVHGESAVDIGFDGMEGSFEFRAPAEDLYGFEHEPKSAAEKSTRDKAIALMQSKIATMIQFDAALGCAITPGQVKYEGGDHVEVHARFDVKCKKSPAGSLVRFGVTQTFPSLGVVNVRVASESGQTGLRVVNNKGTVKL